MILRKSVGRRGRWGAGAEPGKEKPCSSPAGEGLPVFLALAGAVLLRPAGLHQRLLRAVGAEQRVLLRLLVLLQAVARLPAKTCRGETRMKPRGDGPQEVRVATADPSHWKVRLFGFGF